MQPAAMHVCSYFWCVGDMLVKKTLVVLKSMLSLTHCSMSRNAMPYASSVDTHSHAVSLPASSHGPFLLF